MNLEGKTALVLGGAGLVGQAVCRRLLDAGVGTVLVGGLTEAEASDGSSALNADGRAIPVWGNIFVPVSMAFVLPSEMGLDARDQILTHDLEELTDEIYRSSHLVQLVLGTSGVAEGRRPDLIVDAINTATAMAYTGVYNRLGHVLDLRRRGDPESLAGEVDALLASFATPRLVRHVQLLSRAMQAAGTEAYVKVGTTGTGGMGLNIPYTHGEERPSRLLLTKSAIAGAHSMLLFLLSRTPGAPAVKEIKPAAAITWKRIAYGPIKARGQDLGLYDCSREEAVQLNRGEAFHLANAGHRLDGSLESVFVDTGENGLFSVDEYTAVTALGQMEAVTPEDIAKLVVRELQGRATGRDIVAALDGAVTPPSYRAGALRQHAISEGRRLAAEHGVPSVAFELLGPPRLSKLLYEAELLRLAFGTLDRLAEASSQAVAEGLEQQVWAADAVRRAALSVGIPILLGDGHTLLCAARHLRQHRWEQPGWSITPENMDRWTFSEWIDLRSENAEIWRQRARQMVAERNRGQADTHRASNLDRHFEVREFEVGEVAAWILENEDDGYRA